jgi:hypothetical protein
MSFTRGATIGRSQLPRIAQGFSKSPGQRGDGPQGLAP